MAVAEAKARKKMQDVLLRWDKRFSVDQVFSIFRNTEKYTNEKKIGLLKQLFSPHSIDFEKHLAQFETNVLKNKKSAYDSFIIFLNSIQLTPLPQKPQIPVKSASESKMSSKSDFIESPTLSSTRVDHVQKTDIVVSEVSN